MRATSQSTARRHHDAGGRRCYRNLLALCAEQGFRSLAIPAISCGVYRFPLREAASIATGEIARARALGTTLETVSLVAFDQPMLTVLQEAAERGPSAFLPGAGR